jgi:hypothetical protein
VHIERFAQAIYLGIIAVASLGLLFGHGTFQVHQDIWLLVTGASLAGIILAQIMGRQALKQQEHKP